MIPNYLMNNDSFGPEMTLQKGGVSIASAARAMPALIAT
jgi:hypothetical protein